MLNQKIILPLFYIEDPPFVLIRSFHRMWEFTKLIHLLWCCKCQRGTHKFIASPRYMLEIENQQKLKDIFVYYWEKKIRQGRVGYEDVWSYLLFEISRSLFATVSLRKFKLQPHLQFFKILIILLPCGPQNNLYDKSCSWDKWIKME